MTPFQLPTYLHNRRGTISATGNIGDIFGIQLETVGGVNFHSAGDNQYVNVTTQGGSGYLSGLDFTRSEADTSTPPMILIQSPNITHVSLGTGNFVIQTELQMIIKYNMIVEVHRQQDWSQNPDYNVVGPNTNFLRYSDPAFALLRAPLKGVQTSTRQGGTVGSTGFGAFQSGVGRMLRNSCKISETPSDALKKSGNFHLHHVASLLLSS